MAEMKGIKLCGECINYDWKKHKCKIGCNDDSNAQAPFYGDCPLPDVVPKSEVEKEIKNWQELYADTVSKWDKAYEELEAKYEDLQEQFRVLDAECDRMEKVESKQYDDIIKAKAEVAREIFEEIESLLYETDFLDELEYIGFEIGLAELKKKYTEGEPNGQNIKE